MAFRTLFAIFIKIVSILKLVKTQTQPISQLLIKLMVE